MSTVPPKNNLALNSNSYPNNLELLNEIALTCLEGGEFRTGIDHLTHALSIDPTHIESLANRGDAFLRVGDLDSALEDFYELQKQDPDDIDAINQIRFIHRKLVGSWHFDMMNDTERNLAYQSAIESTIKPGMTVFEIGTGSGLLSMMAARAGAKHIYTCETILPIRTATQEIIKRNGYSDRVTVIDKWSTKVELGIDIPERVDVIIAEIFGPALLDEQALHFFDDAKKRLLKPNGKILPANATMFGMLVESDEITKKTVVDTVCGFDVSLFNTIHTDPALQLTLSKYSHRLLSEPFAIKTLEFGSAKDEYSENFFQVVANTDGVCHGIVQWFRLELAPGCFMDTNPSKPSTHWEQHFQVFEKPLQIKKGQTVSFTLKQFSDRFSLTPLS